MRVVLTSKWGRRLKEKERELAQLKNKVPLTDDEKKKLGEQIDALNKEINAMSLILVQFANSFYLYHAIQIKENYKDNYGPVNPAVDYFYLIRRKGDRLYWQGVIPDFKIVEDRKIVSCVSSRWNNIPGKTGNVGLGGWTVKHPFIIEDGRWIILHKMLAEGEEAVVPASVDMFVDEYLYTAPGSIEKMASEQIRSDGELIAMWPDIVETLRDWEDVGKYLGLGGGFVCEPVTQAVGKALNENLNRIHAITGTRKLEEVAGSTVDLEQINLILGQKWVPPELISVIREANANVGANEPFILRLLSGQEEIKKDKIRTELGLVIESQRAWYEKLAPPKFNLHEPVPVAGIVLEGLKEEGLIPAEKPQQGMLQTIVNQGTREHLASHVKYRDEEDVPPIKFSLKRQAVQYLNAYRLVLRLLAEYGDLSRDNTPVMALLYTPFEGLLPEIDAGMLTKLPIMDHNDILVVVPVGGIEKWKNFIADIKAKLQAKMIQNNVVAVEPWEVYIDVPEALTNNNPALSRICVISQEIEVSGAAIAGNQRRLDRGKLKSLGRHVSEINGSILVKVLLQGELDALFGKRPTEAVTTPASDIPLPELPASIPTEPQAKTKVLMFTRNERLIRELLGCCPPDIVLRQANYGQEILSILQDTSTQQFVPDFVIMEIEPSDFHDALAVQAVATATRGLETIFLVNKLKPAALETLKRDCADAHIFDITHGADKVWPKLRNLMEFNWSWVTDDDIKDAQAIVRTLCKGIHLTGYLYEQGLIAALLQKHIEDHWLTEGHEARQIALRARLSRHARAGILLTQTFIAVVAEYNLVKQRAEEVNSLFVLPLTPYFGEADSGRQDVSEVVVFSSQDYRSLFREEVDFLSNLPLKAQITLAEDVDPRTVKYFWNTHGPLEAATGVKLNVIGFELRRTEEKGDRHRFDLDEIIDAYLNHRPQFGKQPEVTVFRPVVKKGKLAVEKILVPSATSQDFGAGLALAGLSSVAGGDTTAFYKQARAH